MAYGPANGLGGGSFSRCCSETLPARPHLQAASDPTHTSDSFGSPHHTPPQAPGRSIGAQPSRGAATAGRRIKRSERPRHI